MIVIIKTKIFSALHGSDGRVRVIWSRFYLGKEEPVSRSLSIFMDVTRNNDVRLDFLIS